MVREAHDAILSGGHSGIAKTAAAVGSRYYWPTLTDSIAEWIAGCDVCHRIKHKNVRAYGLIKPLPIPLEWAERVNIDFVTKLLTSEAGYDAVATIIDPLTKRAWWIHIKEANLTAEKFATAFIDGYVRSWGLPVSIVSDWDTHYPRLLAIIVFTTQNQASDIYGIPSAIGRPGGKGECHSGNVFEGIYSATQIPRAVEPFVAAGGVYLQCSKA